MVTQGGTCDHLLARQFYPAFQWVKSELLFRLRVVTQLERRVCALLGLHTLLTAEEPSH